MYKRQDKDIGWEKFYYDLVKRGINNIAIPKIEEIGNRSYLLMLIQLHILIDYPIIYDKFANKTDLLWEVLYQEIERINPRHPFYEYILSGKIPNGYILRSSYIGVANYYINLLIQMIKDGVKFESADLYYNVVTQRLLYLYAIYGGGIKIFAFEFLDDIKFQKDDIEPLVDYIERNISRKYPQLYRPIVAVLLEYRDS